MSKQQQSEGNIALGYNFLVVGDSDAGIHGVVSAYLEEPSNSGLSTSFLRANQKPVRLADHRILVLDIIERPGDIFRDCCGDLARSHGVLLVYSPTSLSSFQYVMRFHEQLNISKWRSLPVVLFANIPTRRGINLVHGSHGRAFANMHGIPFIEASPGHPSPAPFPALLRLVSAHYGASSAPASYREGVVDFLTVAAGRVSHAARSHFPAFPLSSREDPPRVQRRNHSRSFSAPRCGSFFFPSTWHFPRIPPFRLATSFRQ